MISQDQQTDLKYFSNSVAQPSHHGEYLQRRRTREFEFRDRRILSRTRQIGWLRKEISDLSLDNFTPLEALNKLNELKKKIDEKN